MVLKDLFQEYSNETPESSYKIGNFIFVKDCSSKLKIRKGLLSYIEKSTSKDNDKYVSALSQYIINVLYANENQTTFTNDEKAEIIASISNIEIPALNKYKGQSSNTWGSKASTLFYLQSKNAMNHPEILEILKKQNYFGYFFLKNYIESGQLEDEDPTPPQGDE